MTQLFRDVFYTTRTYLELVCSLVCFCLKVCVVLYNIVYSNVTTSKGCIKSQKLNTNRNLDSCGGILV